MDNEAEVMRIRMRHQEAVRAGMPNLLRHADIVHQFGLPAFVAINIFPTDTEAELSVIDEELARAGVDAARVGAPGRTPDARARQIGRTATPARAAGAEQSEWPRSSIVSPGR